MLVVRLIVVCIEVPLAIALAVAEELRSSPVVHRLADLLVECASAILPRVLQHAAVQESVAHVIAAGVNAFFEQPDLDLHVRSMAACVSKTQPDLARQQGQDFPVIVGSFLQGMIRGVSPKQPRETTTTTTTLDEHKAAEELSETAATTTTTTPPRRKSHAESSSSSSSTEPHALSPATIIVPPAPPPPPKAALHLLHFPTFGGSTGRSVLTTPKRNSSNDASTNTNANDASHDENSAATADAVSESAKHETTSTTNSSSSDDESIRTDTKKQV